MRLSKRIEIGHQMWGRMEWKNGIHIESQRMMSLGFNTSVEYGGSLYVKPIGTHALTLYLLGQLNLK